MAATPGLAVPFLAFPYALAASRVFPHVRVSVIERDGQPVGFFPYQLTDWWRRRLRFAERIGGELSDYFGVVGSPELSLSPAQLLRLTKLNGIFFTHLDESQAAFGLTGVQPEIGLRIDLAAGAEAYWAQLKQSDKKFVTDTERRERKLIEAHGPLRFVFRHDEPAAELQQLIARKRGQYARTGAGDPLTEERTRRFLAELSESDDPLCRGVVSTLHAGDTWVASHFGLMHRGTLHFWFPVYNPDLQSYSPGRMLVATILRRAAELGVTTIDRGVGDSQAKRDFANSEHRFSRGLWHRSNLPANVIKADMALRWRLKAWAERAMSGHPRLDRRKV